MDYHWQVRTEVLPVDSLWQALNDLLQFLRNNGYNDLEIMFGFAWGNYMEPEESWQFISLSLDQVVPRILQEQAREDGGALGNDDLHIRHPSWSFQILFCHESDLHVQYNQREQLIDSIETRWAALGFKPVIDDLTSSEFQWQKR